MKQLIDIAFCVLFGSMSLVAIAAIAFSATALVICLIDLVIDTGIDVSLGSVLQSLVVSLCLFVVSTKLFLYFSKEKLK